MVSEFPPDLWPSPVLRLGGERGCRAETRSLVTDLGARERRGSVRVAGTRQGVAEMPNSEQHDQLPQHYESIGFQGWPAAHAYGASENLPHATNAYARR